MFTWHEVHTDSPGKERRIDMEERKPGCVEEDEEYLWTEIETIFRMLKTEKERIFIFWWDAYEIVDRVTGVWRWEIQDVYLYAMNVAAILF